MKEQTYATASVFWTGFQDSVTVLLNDGGLWKRSWGNNWDDIKFTTSQDFLKYFYMTYFSVFLPHHSQMSFTPRHKSESGRSKQTGPDWRLSHIETHKPTFNDSTAWNQLRHRTESGCINPCICFLTLMRTLMLFVIFRATTLILFWF